MVEKYQEKILEASSKTFSVLIPVMDLTNHDPHVKMVWTQQYDDISLQSQELLGQGQEVYNNYGPKGNEECKSDRLHSSPQSLELTRSSAHGLWILSPREFLGHGQYQVARESLSPAARDQKTSKDPFEGRRYSPSLRCRVP